MNSMDELPNTKAWLERFEANVPKRYPNLVCGWPHEEYGRGWDDYISWCKEQLDEVEEGEDVQPFPTLRDWQDALFDDEDECNLGFSHETCDMCCALPGNRYAATAFNDDHSDYIPMCVCGDCLQYIANGEIPDDMD